MRACRLQRFVGSSTEKVAPTVTKAQQLTGQDELNGAAMPTYGQSGPGQTFETKQIRRAA